MRRPRWAGKPLQLAVDGVPATTEATQLVRFRGKAKVGLRDPQGSFGPATDLAGQRDVLETCQFDFGVAPFVPPEISAAPNYRSLCSVGLKPGFLPHRAAGGSQRTYEKCVSVLRERNIASQTKSRHNWVIRQWSRLEIVNSD